MQPPALALCLCAILPGALNGCAEFPQVDAATSRAAQEGPAPVLLPLDDLLDRAAARPVATDTAQTALLARAARLRARAAAMGAPVTQP